MLTQNGGSPIIFGLGSLECDGYFTDIWPTVLNDVGQVAGNLYLSPYYPCPSLTEAFFYDGGISLIDVSALGWLWTAVSLNHSGQVVGTYQSTDGSGAIFSYLWDGGEVIDLGDLGGGTTSAFSIRDNGSVLGTSFNADGALHLFRYGSVGRQNAMTDLGSVSVFGGDASFLPLGISAVTVVGLTENVMDGQPETLDLAGLGTDASGNARSLLWKDGGIHSVIGLMPAYLSFKAVSHAYGSTVLVNRSEQIACAGTDVSGRQMALLLSLDPDADNDGLPDSWEMLYYGHLGVNKDDLADGGGGLTNWQAYQQGSSPHDFYNGQAPLVAIVGGNNQQAAPTGFVPLPLVVRVSNANGLPAANVPVKFTVSGGGQLQRANVSSPKPTLTLNTDAGGQAKVFFQVSEHPNTAGHVDAQVTAGGFTAQTRFDETSNGGGNGVPPPNPAPPGGNNPPDDPNDPDNPPDVPVQSYACIDLSGSVQGSNNVDQVVLNDAGVAAFGFQSGDTYTTYQFTNGQPNHVQDLELHVTGGGANGSIQEIERNLLIINSQGTIYGREHLISGEFESNKSFACRNGVTIPLLPPDPPYGPGEDGLNSVFCYHANDSGYCGTASGYTPNPDDPTGGSYNLVIGGVICCGGSTIQTGTLESGNAFMPVLMNNTGSAIGSRDNFYSGILTFRNGITQALVDFETEPSALNDQNQIVCEWGGYLWEDGKKTILVDHLPASLKDKIVDIRPYAISNQTNPAPGPDRDVTIYILAWANVNGMAGVTIVCTRNNDGDWSYARVQSPNGTTVSRYVSINSHGVVASVGKVSSGPWNNRLNQTDTDSSPDAALVGPTVELHAFGRSDYADLDTNMAYDGDNIDSNKKGQLGAQKHFVVPKAADGYVSVKARVSKDADWPNFTSAYKFVVIKVTGQDSSGQYTGNEIICSTDSLGTTVYVPTSTADHYVIKVCKKEDTENKPIVGIQNVWVVWWDIESHNATLANGGDQIVQDTTATDRTAISTRSNYKATANPREICNPDNDIPDLTGFNVLKTPHQGEPHELVLNTSIPGALYYWDITRQWRERDLVPTVNSDGVGIPSYSRMYGILPNANIIQSTSADTNKSANAANIGYPKDETEGNDDGGNDHNPYDKTSYATLIDYDGGPQRFVLRTAGNVGDRLELRAQLREFVRANIGGVWYRVSDYAYARLHARLKKVDHYMNISTPLWINDSSIADESNAGF